MSLTDIIVLIIVLSLFLGITIFLIVKYKNNPCYGCSFSKKGRKNRLTFRCNVQNKIIKVTIFKTEIENRE